MRTKILLLSASMSVCALNAGPIDEFTLNKIIKIGLEAGVPKSVTIQLQIEESGDWRRGTWGNIKAKSKIVNGYRSRGLFQLYEHPRNLSQLLNKFWYPYLDGFVGESKKFDIHNPFHNASVALRYLAALRKEYGSWYKACLFYNCGRIRKPPEETKLYARRIINAR